MNVETPGSVALGQLLEGSPYRLTQLIGRGATAFVYRGEHTSLRTPVIVKIMEATVDAAPEAADRMRLEAQALARLTHPNLVSVTDFGVADGRMFFVMDDEGGVSLAESLGATGRMNPSDALTVAGEVLEGLAFIHENGLIHRNIHPNNVLLGPGTDSRRTVRILDLGLLKVLAGHEQHRLSPLALPTAEGTTLGTPRYMAPEQARGTHLDARADLYALGCLLYRLLVGHDPFAHHATTGRVLAAHLGEAVIPPSRTTANAGIGPAIERALMTALAKRPEERFETARAMKSALLAAWTADAGFRGTPAPTVGFAPGAAVSLQELSHPPRASGAPPPRASDAPLAQAQARMPTVGLPEAVAEARPRPLPGEPARASRPGQPGAPAPLPAASRGPSELEPHRGARSSAAIVGTFSVAWLASLLLTVTALFAARNCGPSPAHGERGAVHDKRLSTR